MKIDQLKKLKLPSKPGVYFFKTKGAIIYIGKATSLRDRVRSYFSKDLIATRGPLILDMIFQADDILWQETDSVLEALILEANLIKRHQPKYNTKEKDNKSWNYVCITKELIPKIIVVRGRNLGTCDYKVAYGPFTNGLQLREALRIIRRIFPFIDASASKKQNFEFYKQLGLVPSLEGLEYKNSRSGGVSKANGLTRGPEFLYSNPESLINYKKNIANIKLFFQGRKKKIILNLKKEMNSSAKSKDFENAARVRNQIFALQHINDIALIKGDKERGNSAYRIEAYDIAHMSGKNMVGVMTVVIDGERVVSEYRKFIIKTQDHSNDTGALLEVLSRRLKHTEWSLPDLIVVDGSTAQLNIGKKAVSDAALDIPVVALVKDDRHKARAIIGEEALVIAHKKAILLANSEAHRFAITFHRQKRGKMFL
jgi:excinuclease ABC subunit C